jgi:hypothetical protein
MKVLLEESWNADDIVSFCIEKGIECLILSEKELYDRNDFFECIYFCNTDIVRHHLQKYNIPKPVLDKLYPDTYECIYSKYFKRRHRIINRDLIEDLLLKEKNVFVKPVGNDKSFDGRVISSIDDIEALLSESELHENETVYACEVVEFLSENRLLVGNGKLYGYGHICKKKDYSFLSQMDINQIIELTGDNFRCIDVGLTKEKGWVIIEINPPFSLDDYEIPLDMYMNFCIGACQWINMFLKKAIFAQQKSSVFLDEKKSIKTD